MVNTYTDIARRNLFDDICTDRMLPNGLLGEVILNVIDKCNRHCAYCPHGNGYMSPHDGKCIDSSVIDKICSDLGRLYDGIFSISGFGEPTLNSQLYEIVLKLRNACPMASIMLNTNGDNALALCSMPHVDKLRIIVSNHNTSSIQIDVLERFSNAPNAIEINDIHKKASMYFNNRAGNVKHTANESIQLPLANCCSIPFYKMFVDVNGDILQCCSDWKRTNVIGNVLKEDIYSIWTNENYKKLRTQLVKKDRHNALCEFCSTAGMLTGSKYVQQWKQFYQMA